MLVGVIMSKSIVEEMRIREIGGWGVDGIVFGLIGVWFIFGRVKKFKWV